jgi:DNA-binding NtrC family response regulator
MSRECERQRPLDILLSDLTCGSPESAGLCELLRSVDGFSVVTEVARPGHRTTIARPNSLVVLVLPRLPESEQRHLLANLDPGNGGAVIVAALHPEAEAISRWMDGGAADYFSPPWDLASILPRIRKAARCQTSRGEAASPARKKLALEQMIGHSAAFRLAIDRIGAIAACDAGVLISGETGAGKELCARAIHYLGQRSRQPF